MKSREDKDISDGNGNFGRPEIGRCL